MHTRDYYGISQVLFPSLAWTSTAVGLWIKIRNNQDWINPSSLENFCLVWLISDLEHYPPELLALLPLKFSKKKHLTQCMCSILHLKPSEVSLKV